VNIFFDVDYTILSADGALRNNTREVFGRLIHDGHRIHIWSGEGRREAVVTAHGLTPYVSGIFAKPLTDYPAGLRRFGVDPVPDFIIDDYPQIVAFFGGFHIRDFYSANDYDDEMETVYRVVQELVETGASSHPRWRARHPDFDTLMSAAPRR